MSDNLLGNGWEFRAHFEKPPEEHAAEREIAPDPCDGCQWNDDHGMNCAWELGMDAPEGCQNTTEEAPDPGGTIPMFDEVATDGEPVSFEQPAFEVVQEDAEQPALFDAPKDWERTWQGMPGYDHAELRPDTTMLVHFKNKTDRKAFADLIGQRVTPKTKSVWYPQVEISRFITQSYAAEKPKDPRYPIYIVSKGRADTRLTAKALESMNTPYFIVVEPQEYEQYAAVIDPAKILTLPFSNLGLGSVPARNWIWEHALASGAERHWVLDDNIRGFHRFHDNMLHRVLDGTIFNAAEEFVDRYENVALAAFQYFMFVPRKSGRIPPYYLNTRCYSCILVRNDLPYRWRGRWNEDTDLSLQALKGGWATVLFNAFVCDKMTTMTMKGGNSDDYDEQGRLAATMVLVNAHPDVARVTQRFGRTHHYVDYSRFKRNELRLRSDVELPPESEYAMALKVHPGWEDEVLGDVLEPPGDEETSQSSNESIPAAEDVVQPDTASGDVLEAAPKAEWTPDPDQYARGQADRRLGQTLQACPFLQKRAVDSWEAGWMAEALKMRDRVTE